MLVATIPGWLLMTAVLWAVIWASSWIITGSHDYRDLVIAGWLALLSLLGFRSRTSRV